MNLDSAKLLCIDNLLTPFEGTGPISKDGKFLAYKDPASKNGLPITIAWGSTYDELGNPIKLGDEWSKEKAIRVKNVVLDQFAWRVIELCPTLVDQPDSMFAAVLSLDRKSVV